MESLNEVKKEGLIGGDIKAISYSQSYFHLQNNAFKFVLKRLYKRIMHLHNIYEAQARIYKIYENERLLWCANSPDLNAIEPTWY